MKNGGLTVVIAFFAATVAEAAIVDLNTWTAESYNAVSGFPAGDWQVSGGGSTVTQVNNGQPTLFYSDFQAINTNAVGRIRVTGSDDDFIGFVLGFDPGDTTSAAADYLLLDWKRGTQFFNFGAPSASPGGTAFAGLAVSQVTGIPDADEFWQHANLGGTPVGSGLLELARGSGLGNTGWVIGTEYVFDFNFTATQLQVFVDGALEIDIAGSFSDGRLGFYNFSQADVTYSSFTIEQIPEPTSFALFALGFTWLGFVRRGRAV